MEPKRIGCLYIPDFRIQVHRNDEGLSPETPLVLLTPQGRRFLVCAASAGAEAAGVRPGMTSAQAEVACPQALFREEAPKRYTLVHEQLLGGLQALTPQVEATRLGLYYLGMRGLRWLFKDEAALLRGGLEEAVALRLEATAGAAGSRFTALIAARVALPNAYRQVGPQDDARFLATMPLSMLPVTAELLERLKLVGLESMADLAALSPRAVERRYGQPGVEAWRLSRAEDDAHLTPTLPPVAYSRHLLLEHPAENAEGLLFLLVPLLESLLETLRQEGRACAALSLQLRLERQEPDAGPMMVPLPLGTPVTQIKPLQDLLRLKLAKVELPSGVVEATLIATRVTEPSTPQGDLFRRVGSPSGMAVTLARLVDALGPEHVVQGQELDAWRPDRTFRLNSVQDGAPELLAAANHQARPAESKSRSPKGRGTRQATKGNPANSNPAKGTPAKGTPAKGNPAKSDAAKGEITADSTSHAASGQGNTPNAQLTSIHSSQSMASQTTAAQVSQPMAASPSSSLPSAASPQSPPQLSLSSPLKPQGGGAQFATAGQLPDICLKAGFRRVMPPRLVQMQQDETGPLAILMGQRRRQILTQQGPFRYEGLWWEQDFSRDYYQLTLQDQTQMMVYRDCMTDQWFLEGFYD